MAKRQLLRKEQLIDMINNGSIKNIVENIVEVDFETERFYSLDSLDAVDFVKDLFNEDRIFFLITEEE